MIKEVKGDIRLTKAQAIAHGVAPHDHFDSGLALSLRKDHPTMAKDFRHYCRLKNPPAGDVWMWGTVGNLRFFNLMTQEPAEFHDGHPGQATMQNVNNCLKKLATMIEEEEITSIAIPKLATGYGKLDWEEVFPAIKERLADVKIPIYVYSTYIEGVQAEEN